MPNGEEKREWPIRGEEDLDRILSSPEIQKASWLERLFTNVAAIFSLTFRQIWDHLDRIFTFKISRSKTFISDYQKNISMPIFKWLLEDARKEGYLDDRTAAVLEALKPEWPVADAAYTLFVVSSLIKNYLGTSMQGMSGNLIQKINKDYRPNLIDPNSAVAAAFIAPEKTGEVREILKRHGLKDSDIDLLFIARYQRQDIQTVMMCYLRKIITKETTFERLRELGYTDTRIDELMATWEIIPGPQDLLMMVGKEAFEPIPIAKFGLADEFPEAQSEWLTKQGLSRFWQEKYWIAHWNYPGPQQVLDLLHRGLVTKDEVYEYYKVVEMPTFWRDKLMQASYPPFTRVDTRRMHKMGVMSDEEIIKEYMIQGYDQDHALKLAEFTKRYNAEGSKNLSMSQIIKSYRNSLITREQAAGLLGMIKWSPDQVEWLLVNADFDEALELQSLYINAVKTKYLDNVLSDLDTRTELTKLNLPGARIDALMGAWYANKLAKVKLPSKTDLDKFLKAKIINTDQYKTEMYRLGYSFQYTDWYLQTIKETAPAKPPTPVKITEMP